LPGNLKKLRYFCFLLLTLLGLISNAPLKAIMKSCLLTLLCFAAYSTSNAQEKSTYEKEHLNSCKKDVTLWYEAFTKKDPALLDRILHDDWVDIPGASGTPPGPGGVKPLLAQLTTTFPDLKLTIGDILQDGNKVVVRAKMAGTQSQPFMGFPSKKPQNGHSGCRYPRIQRGENCSYVAHRGLDDGSSSVGCFREVVPNRSQG
jgi:predicted ester cyclase